MQTYLAGPIGKMTIEEANQWREYVKRVLYDIYEVEVKNPLRGKKEHERNNYTDAEIVQRDKQDIKYSDFMIVNWPERCVSNGTAMEIMYAWENEVPVIFIGDWAKDDVWTRYHATRIFSNLNEAIKYIEEMWL